MLFEEAKMDVVEVLLYSYGNFILILS